MPKLTSTRGARDLFVPDDQVDQWQSLVRSGDWAVAPGEDVSIVDAYGHQTVVDAQALQRDTARGVENKVEDQDTVVRRARNKRLESQTSTGGSLLRGAASGVSFGLSDSLFDDETIEADQLHHGTARFAGEALGIGATLFLGNDLGLSKLGGRLLGTEAAAGRASAGARELAAAGDALAAEHVGSALSSNAVLAGRGEATVAERSLARSGRALDEATAARHGIANVPQDLIGLDAAGLRRAAAEERAALKSQAAEERLSLEELRKPQREELANQIRDLHAEMMTERPVFQAVVGADVRKLEGVKDIASQLNGSYKGLRRKLDNSLRAAEDPGILLGDLQMRQTALESLQLKAPEIRAALGDDARALALDHVDDALELTRHQITAIKHLSPRNPVTGTRLAELESGVSQRLLAIESAQEAIKTAPEIGLLGRGAKAGVFAGATALAHAIPGVGVAAPFVGKWASEGIGRTFEHLGAARAAIAQRSKQALDKFLDVTTRNPAATAGAVAKTATQVLSDVRFSPVESPAPSSSSSKTKLPALFKARSAEIRSQTMYAPDGQVVIRPEARQAIAKRLAPIAAVNPLLADQLESLAVRKAEYISSKLPRQPDVGGLQIGPDNWKPSELEMRSWARTVRAVEDPGSVEEQLAAGIVTPEAAEAYRTVYPERFAAMQRAIFEAAPTLSKTLPMQRKIALSIFTGVPLIPALQPNVLQVLQGNFAVETGSAGGGQPPPPQPNFGALGSMKSSEKPTPAQARETA